MTSPECTPKIGDQVMCGPLTVADGPYVFGGVYVRECDAVDPTFCSDTVMLSTVYPWHEALPAVARWLAEHGDSSLTGLYFPDEWVDWLGDRVDLAKEDGASIEDQAFYDHIKLVVMPALRALIAALTTEGV